MDKIETARLSCNHQGRQLHIVSCSHSGTDGHGRYYVHLCTMCGQFIVFVEENGETTKLIFGVSRDDQIEAVLKYRKYLGFEDDQPDADPAETK